MAEEANTSWGTLRGKLSLNQQRVALHEHVIELQLELARRLERRGIAGEIITLLLDADHDSLERRAEAGAEIDLAALTDELAGRAEERPPG